MKRILLIAFLVCLVPVWAWGADHVAKKSGSDTVYKVGNLSNCEDAEGWSAASDLESAAAATGSDTLYICDGTYTDANLDSDNMLNIMADGQTIQGESQLETILISTDNTVVANSSRTNAWVKDCTLKNSNATNDKYGILDGAGTSTEDVIIDGVDIGISLASAATTTHNRLKIQDCPDRWIYKTGSGTATFTSSVFLRSGVYGALIYDGVVNFYNSLLLGSGQEVIYHVGANDPVTNIKNCVIDASVYDGGNDYVLNENATSGSITADYCLVNRKSLGPSSALYTTGTVTIINAISGQDPGFTTKNRPAIIVIGVDDNTNYEYFETLAGKLDSYGWDGVWAMSGDPSSAAVTAAETVMANGHEIACHGYQYANAFMDLEGITIQYTGGDASSATVSIASDTLTTTITDGAGPNLNLDLTSTSYDTLTELAAYINGLASYSCTNDNAESGGGYSPYLADTSDADINGIDAGCDCDSTKFYTGEISDSVTSLESEISGLTVSVFVPPGNQTDAALQAELLSQGFVGARGGTFATGSYKMSSVNVFNIMGIGLYTFFGNDASPNAATVKSYIASLTGMLKQIGGIAYLFSHNTSGLTYDSWDLVLDEIRASGVEVMKLSEAVTYLTSYDPSGDLATVDNMTYTRTMTNNGDFTLTSTSPCVNKGIDPFVNGDGDQTDMAGETVWDDTQDRPVGTWRDGVDIGAYGYYLTTPTSQGVSIGGP